MCNTELRGCRWLGCYIVLSYVLYWPTFWLARAGGEWCANKNPGLVIDYGPPEFWAMMWVLAPVTTPFNLLIAATYWVISPAIDIIVKVCW